MLKKKDSLIFLRGHSVLQHEDESYKAKQEKKKPRALDRGVFILLLIIFAAAALRLTGISYSFPFIFHPDEPTIVRSALGIRFGANPKHFDWPHLYIYLNYFLYMIFARFRSFLSAIGLREKSALLFPLMWDEKVIYYYLTRCFSAILGALTVIPVYLAGKNLFGKKVGFFAAAVFAVLPYHVWHSHYSLPDVPMTFLLSWGLYFSSLIIKKADLKNYLFSGLFIGLAASTKYNGGLSALMVPTAHFLRIFWQRKVGREEETQESVEKVKIIDFRGILALILAGLSAFVGFIIGTPYALLDFKTFFSKDWGTGALWQFSNVGSVGFVEHVSKFFTELVLKLSQNMGYTVILAYILTLGYLVYRMVKKHIEQRDYRLFFLYIVSLFLVWYISGFEENRAHYYFIFYPFAALIFGFFVDRVYDSLIKRKKVLSKVFVITAFALPVLFSLISSYRFYNGDTRNYLYKWLVSNLQLGENVIYNDKKLKDVFGIIGVSAKKSLDAEELNLVKSALIVLSDPQNESEFLSKNSKFLKLEVSFSSKFKLGPDIVVYRYIK